VIEALILVVLCIIALSILAMGSILEFGMKNIVEHLSELKPQDKGAE